MNMSLHSLSPAELLYIANCHNAHESRFLHKVFQIKSYDWLSGPMLEECVARMESLGIGRHSVYFEHALPEVRNRMEMFGRSLVGVADCIDERNRCLYEFKCVAALTTEHVLQLALYMYMHNCASGRRGAGGIVGRLYNIRTDELVEIANDNPAAIEAVVRTLCEAKFSPKSRVPDAQFLAAAAVVRRRVRGLMDKKEIRSSCDNDADDDYLMPPKRRRVENTAVLTDAPEDLVPPPRRSKRIGKNSRTTTK